MDGAVFFRVKKRADVIVRENRELVSAREAADFLQELPTLLTESEARLAGVKAALLVQRRRIEELSVQRASYTLRAPICGQVVDLMGSPGEHFLEGALILSLPDPVPNEINSLAVS